MSNKTPQSTTKQQKGHKRTEKSTQKEVNNIMKKIQKRLVIENKQIRKKSR